MREKPMIWVKEAKYIEGFRIQIRFNDGTVGDVDLAATIQEDSREIFQQLKELDQFRRFSVKMDTIVWDNGLDLAPEFLFEMATGDVAQRPTTGVCGS